MQLFYLPNIQKGQFILDEAESIHCVKVLRHGLGDVIHVTDGEGKLYQASIIEAKPKACSLGNFTVVREEIAKPYFIHIAIAPTKNVERIEWFVEKAIELGIDQISFLHCQNSERKGINLERIQKKAIGALKQSLHLKLPVLSEEMPFKKFISEPLNGQKFIAYVDEHHEAHLKTEARASQHYTILIGPEGDFTEEEIKLSFAQQFLPVSLGKSRLRTETAGLAACMMLNWLNE